MGYCCLCNLKIKGVGRSVKGGFWYRWSNFCHLNYVQPFEDDLLDKSCYSWIIKYGSKNLDVVEAGGKRSIVADNIRILREKRPHAGESSEKMETCQDMEVDFEPSAQSVRTPTRRLEEGRRIISTQSLCDFVQKLSTHAKCSDYAFQFSREKRNGLRSEIFFKCQCGAAEFKIDSDSDKESLAINDAMAWGCAQAPIGYQAASAFLTTMDLKGPGKNTFRKLQQKSYEVISKAATQTMAAAGQLERKLAEDSDDFVEVEGVKYPRATIKVDGGWGKRSYGHGFNSHCGTAVGIGAKTKKILFNDTRVRTCIICDKAKNRGDEPIFHECYKNWNKASTAMESNIIQEGFLRSISTHGLVYSKFVGDGDSSTHAAVINSYKGIQVEKIECSNHVMRNLTRKLMEISQNRKKNIPAHIRKLPGMSTRFERITGGIVGAVNHHIASLSNDTWKQLRADILNVPRHVFGDHSFCKSYFCRKDDQSRKEVNIYPTVSATPLYSDVMEAVKRVASLSTSLLERMNTNEAECFMAVVNKYMEGKRKHLGHRNGYNLRIASSVLAYNTTTFWAANAYEIAYNKPPSMLWKEKQSASYSVRNKETKRRMRKRPKYSFLKAKVGDQNYGSCPDKPDLEEVDLNEFNLRILDLHRSLQLNDTRIKEVEESTRCQAHCDIWSAEREARMTASLGHTASHLRETTDNTATLNLVLGRSLFSTEDTSYGKEHEAEAILEYQRISGIPSGVVTPAGLVVSKEDGVLAASPDAFVGDEGLLEVKCPSKWRDSDAKTWPRLLPPKKKRTPNDEPELKKSDPYYTQVIMQLHVTGRKWVDFFVWTPKGSFVQRIIRSEATLKLWERIKAKLLNFWWTEVAPELVDSRYLRGREYRCPEARKASREILKAKKLAGKKVKVRIESNIDLDI